MAVPPSSFGLGALAVEDATAESFDSLGRGPRASFFGPVVAQPTSNPPRTKASVVIRMCGLIRQVVVPPQAICVTVAAGCGNNSETSGGKRPLSGALDHGRGAHSAADAHGDAAVAAVAARELMED